MLPQITSLASAIDSYKAISEGGDNGGENIENIIFDAVSKVWNILGEGNTSIKVIIDSFDRLYQGQKGEYEGRIALMQKAYSTGDKSIFIIQLLSLFGFSNPEMFIVDGRICPIIEPLISTNIKIGVIMRYEKELEKHKPKRGPDLEGISAIASAYSPTYNALIAKKTGIQNIVHDELIVPLAEDAPFIQRQYGPLIALYEKYEVKLLEVTNLEKRAGNIKILNKRGAGNSIVKIESQILKKTNELNAILQQIRITKDPFSLDDIVIYIQRKFGNYYKKRKLPTQDESKEIITSQKIKAKIRRGISVGVHRNEELKKVRINAGSMNHMIQMYEKLIEKYLRISEQIDDPVKILELVTLFKGELELWEIESNALIDEFSLSYIRRLRDQIIEQLLSKK